MSEIIQDNKFVELTYEVIDKKSGDVLSTVEFPLSYVHGTNHVLNSQVTDDLQGRCQGDVIEVAIDGNAIYGARDESLVFTDSIDNVPEEYREVGTIILMESESGERKEFIVTRMDDKTLTVDGNNPLCGRDLIFRLKILSVRDATPEEIEAGTRVIDGPDIDTDRIVPI
ncbi:FKBP-type peptidyl-prolyl cis-trans isomerase [Thioalkalivibrio sulfidiphilus]|uniref:FKBP-type peptidyl-prolyl cis-trans isomerase n=1 Tax=Thioalkalivibrio sulfidiphilus TaxID=1033854 RepID=UPI000380935C|nr:peptidyl-prolyl cis-trans isomerase [Thioalkalivibrio sulfidiphilus]